MSATESMADRIVREITDAIVDQRLAPGTKLAEEALADLFSVSRTTVRAALQRLSAEGLVIIKPNRGAFVFKPTIEESRHVFEARRILEDALLRFAFEAFTAKERNRLQKCLEQEKNARETKSRGKSIKLSGDFHIELARLSGNPIMIGILQEMIYKTSLIISVYGSPGLEICRDHHHEEILSLIEGGDIDGACESMKNHLTEIENEVVGLGRKTSTTDLYSVFQPVSRKG